ncbi:IgaA/UmoB family intracellular growth attenuator [Budvicia diplopodorum]|uniref:IgaA/UmoB family intracellular growth attenuator n=1 Tax=Budvicia diplopodorum TaxID=1119056 RepID=UPI00135AB222|nr:IgaA/UmoB family intracellular growth attenuator [Budvicia diplopodorum]
MLVSDDVNAFTLLLLITFVVLFSMAIYQWKLRNKAKNSKNDYHHLPFVHNKSRKLSSVEKLAIDEYLEFLEADNQDGSKSATPIKLSLMPYSDNLYYFNSAITIINGSDEKSPGKRYYMDGIEIALEPSWAEYLQDVNQVSVVKTQTIPLVLELNDQKLIDYVLSKRQQGPSPTHYSEQAERKIEEQDENVELIRLRQETVEEFNLKHKRRLYESVILSIAYTIIFFSLLSPTMLLPWLIILALILLAIGIWRLLRDSTKRTQFTIHCLRGVPKRWGLFGESDTDQLTSISVGTIDLIYPPHWKPYVGCDIEHPTNIDIYPNRYVVKQGEFLSLHDESVNFPLHHWGKNLILTIASLFIIILLTSFISLKLPLELSAAWLQGTKNITVATPEQLTEAKVKIGDNLTISGTGMCSIPAIYRSDIIYPFMPFDCTEMYWGAENLPSLPSSEIIDNAMALLDSVNYQLNPLNNEVLHRNPELAKAAQRAGMTVVPNFSDIILKTENLCRDSGDCRRLKNSLLVLSNEKEWEGLVEKSQNHTLKNTDVFLRPMTADALRSQVNSIVSSFFYSQTHLAAQALYIKPQGGFYIRNDDDEKQMVSSDAAKDLTHPDISLDTLYDNIAIKQWFELKQLSSSLLNTPFSTSGIVIEIKKIDNETTKISLHSESSLISFWRYFGASLLLIMMIGSLLYNTIMLIIRVSKNSQRILKIQNYYDLCFANDRSLKVQQS